MKSWEPEELEWVACDGCGRGAASSRTWMRPDGLRVERCANCGHGFLNPRPKAALLGGLYGEDYFDGTRADRGEGGLRSGESLGEMPGGVHLIEEALGGFRGTRLLEVGCADGTLLELLQELGADAIGLDLSPVAVRAALARGLAVREGTLENLPVSDTSPFDGVIAREVVEHVESPKRFLAAARNVLRPGGFLLVTTPNLDCGMRFGDRWMGFRTSFEHLHFFSPSTLRRLAIGVGLEFSSWETSQALGCGPDGLTRGQWFRNHAAYVRELLTRFGFRRAIQVICSKDNDLYYPYGVGHTLYALLRRPIEDRS